MEIKKKNKYGSRKILIDGILYDSKLEADRHQQLKILERAGIIKDLKYHVSLPIIEKSEFGGQICYEADFVYIKDGKKVIEDVKSEPTKTRLYRLKKRLIAEKYGIVITEYMKEKEE